jgi:hypothetical protein
MSTQLKVRFVSAAPSCVAVDFISIETGTIPEQAKTDNLFHVTIWWRTGSGGELGQKRVGGLRSGGSALMARRRLPRFFSFEDAKREPFAYFGNNG